MIIKTLLFLLENRQRIIQTFCLVAAVLEYLPESKKVVRKRKSNGRKR